MTILFDATRQVKRTPRTFGRGLLRALPVQRVEYTASDAAWWAAERAAAEDRHFDALADEAMAQARLDMGLCL